jgi:hypothetical protein
MTRHRANQNPEKIQERRVVNATDMAMEGT